MLYETYIQSAREDFLNKNQKAIMELAMKLQTEAHVRLVADDLVRLTNGDRAKAVPCIKIIRTAFSLGLKESKEAYDSAHATYVRKDDLPF